MAHKEESKDNTVQGEGYLSRFFLSHLTKTSTRSQEIREWSAWPSIVVCGQAFFRFKLYLCFIQIWRELSQGAENLSRKSFRNLIGSQDLRPVEIVTDAIYTDCSELFIRGSFSTVVDAYESAENNSMFSF